MTRCFPFVFLFGVLLHLFIKDTSAQSALEEKIGKAFLASIGGSYEFKYYLLDGQEPNALDTAGAYNFMNRGLFPILDTEGEFTGSKGEEVLQYLELMAIINRMDPLDNVIGK